MTDVTAEPETLSVLDTTAIPPYSPRHHTIVVGGIEVSYDFHAGKPLPMPRTHALKFLGESSFQVTDGEGRRYTPPADPKKSEAATGVVLADNEVVARLDELTVDALLMRANIISGGERLTKRNGRDEVQAFYANHLAKAKGASRRAAARAEKELEDGEVDEMSSAELEKMFGEG